MNEQRRARTKLLLIGAMFLAPLVAAITIFFYVPEWSPQGRVNYGTLVSPARALPSLALVDAAGAPAPTTFSGKWSLVQLGGASCGESCQSRLLLTRQVRLALAKDRLRVQRVYLAPDPASLAAARALLASGNPDLVLVAETGRRAAAFFAPADAEAVYLLDPLGNWLMVYAGTVEPKGLLKDLKKLLRYSQVG